MTPRLSNNVWPVSVKKGFREEDLFGYGNVYLSSHCLFTNL